MLIWRFVNMIDMLICRYVDMLICWYVYALICWDVDSLISRHVDVLICWFQYVVKLICWCVDMLICCYVNVLICWHAIAPGGWLTEVRIPHRTHFASLQGVFLRIHFSHWRLTNWCLAPDGTTFQVMSPSYISALVCWRPWCARTTGVRAPLAYPPPTSTTLG